jgi:hypothetical protein
MASPLFGLEELVEGGTGNVEQYNLHLMIFDALSHRVITNNQLTTPPGSGLADGQVYYVNSSTPSGDWSGHGYELAIRVAGGWEFVSCPDKAWFFIVEAGATDNRIYQYTASSRTWAIPTGL